MVVRTLLHAWPSTFSVAAPAALAAIVAVIVSTNQTPLANAQDGASCATILASASYRGYGYNHIVTVDNGCEYAVACNVWTNVDAEPKHSFEVEAKGTKSVTTRAGSPSSVVTAHGSCVRGS